MEFVNEKVSAVRKLMVKQRLQIKMFPDYY